jgi:hypothetical protein
MVSPTPGMSSEGRRAGHPWSKREICWEVSGWHKAASEHCYSLLGFLKSRNSGSSKGASLLTSELWETIWDISQLSHSHNLKWGPVDQCSCFRFRFNVDGWKQCWITSHKLWNIKDEDAERPPWSIFCAWIECCPQALRWLECNEAEPELGIDFA